MTEHLQPIEAVAEMLGMTGRRLRQFVEAGAIPRPERGKIDPAWALHLYGGTQAAAELQKKPDDPGVLVALSWLIGTGAASARADRHLLAELFTRNGKSEADAMVALGQAMALVSR